MCRAFAELALHYILRVATGLLTRPLEEQRERQYVMEALPKPMVAGNYEPTAPSCFFGESFRDKVVVKAEVGEGKPRTLKHTPDSLRHTSEP